jgi:hypothetical protein
MLVAAAAAQAQWEVRLLLAQVEQVALAHQVQLVVPLLHTLVAVVVALLRRVRVALVAVVLEMEPMELLTQVVVVVVLI